MSEFLKVDQIFNIDCLEGMKKIRDKSIDIVFCDLPYGTTKCRWDTPVDLEALWLEYGRIVKDHGAILLFAQTPFDKILGCSNLKLLRYEWIWEKTHASGHYNANKMPLKAHENILVFYKKLPVYHPQKTSGHSPVHAYTKRVKTQNNTELYGRATKEFSGGGSTERYPRSVIEFPTDVQKSCIHTTQKPLELCRYMIRTYSDPGDLLLDHCCGSGSIPLAAKLEGRHYIGMDNGICTKPGPNYGRPWADIATQRIENYELEVES